MGSKNNPGPFDCYAAALPDEPMFVLLARDLLAPILVDLWATLRAEHGCKEHDRPHEHKVAEARQCADNMRTWKAEQ